MIFFLTFYYYYRVGICLPSSKFWHSKTNRKGFIFLFYGSITSIVIKIIEVLLGGVLAQFFFVFCATVRYVVTDRDPNKIWLCVILFLGGGFSRQPLILFQGGSGGEPPREKQKVLLSLT
jgi:hypothetical protein